MTLGRILAKRLHMDTSFCGSQSRLSGGGWQSIHNESAPSDDPVERPTRHCYLYVCTRA